MKKFTVKQKVFALGSKFDIINENNEKEYYVKADLFDIGKNISVFNNDGIKILYMRQVIRIGAHRYIIYDKNNIEIGEVKKELLVPSYNIEGTFGQLEMKATDFLGRHYIVYKDDVCIGQIGKKITFIRDEYYLEVNDSIYTELLVGLLIMIDMIKFNGNKNNG